MEQSKGRRVILFPMPFQGHINPMLELANILHSKGFSVAIIYTNFNSLNPSTLNPNFTYHSIPVDLTENEASIKDPTLRLSILNAKCVEPFRECLSGLLSDDVNSEDPVACLISDPLFDFTRSVAESFKLPRIVLRTGGAASFAVYAAFPLLKEKGYLPIPVNTSAMNLSSIEPLNGGYFKKWKQDIEIVLGLMDFNLALREDEPTPMDENSTADQRLKFEKWEKANKM